MLECDVIRLWPMIFQRLPLSSLLCGQSDGIGTLAIIWQAEYQGIRRPYPDPPNSVPALGCRNFCNRQGMQYMVDIQVVNIPTRDNIYFFVPFRVLASRWRQTAPFVVPQVRKILGYDIGSHTIDMKYNNFPQKIRISRAQNKFIWFCRAEVSKTQSKNTDKPAQNKFI